MYGDSNNKYSVFYDPKYTMNITINGQLSLCLLAEKLLTIEGLKIIQVNTDGVTVAVPIGRETEYYNICDEWQKQVGLQLEYAEYSKMYIRDVNSYIAVYTNGKIKRKGAYQYEDLGWHQNHSALVIPKAAEAAMLHGKDIAEFVLSILKILITNGTLCCVQKYHVLVNLYLSRMTKKLYCRTFADTILVKMVVNL